MAEPDRRSHRRRRLLDLLRALPLLGLWGWLLPVLWPRGEVTTSAALVFIFAVWLALVLLAALLGRAPEDPKGTPWSR